MLLKVLFLYIFFASALLLLDEEIIPNISSLKVGKIQYPRNISPMILNDYTESQDTGSLSCQKFFCKPSSMIFAAGTCAYNNVSALSIYVQNCNGNLVCEPLSGNNNYTCQIPPVYPNNLYPGEKCKTLSDCISSCKSCTNGICVGADLGADCSSYSDCNPSLTCSSSTSMCVAQIQIGEYGCKTDYDCVNGAGCNSTNNNVGYCISYFSVLPHQYVGSCYRGQSSLCSSLTCAQYGNQFLCTIPIASASSLPVSCSVNGNCSSTSDPFFNPPFNLSSYCSCGYNSNGNSYCSLLPGDPLYMNYINQYKKWLTSSAIRNCNTMNRFDLTCISNWWDTKNFNILMYYNLNVIAYTSVQAAPSCVLQTLFPEYLQYPSPTPFCPTFQCKLANQVFESSQCAYYDGNMNFYVQACSNPNTVCNFISGQNSTCVPIIKYPGQNCTFSNECYTYACVNGVCQGGGKGSKCEKSAACNPGLYCSNNECKPLKGMGESCTSDSNCAYGSLCMSKIQRCVPIGSLEVHSPVNECPNNINLLCQYGSCMQNQDSGNFYCSESVQAQSEFPELCDGNGGCCNSTNDDFFSPSNLTESCFCISNATYSGVCPLFPGDGPMQLAIQQVMSWHKSDAIKKCNSDKREYISCAKEMWDSTNYQNLINYLSYVQFYPINLEFNKCVKSALTANLYGKMSNYLTSYRFSNFNS